LSCKSRNTKIIGDNILMIIISPQGTIEAALVVFEEVEVAVLPS
jgi:hypothetical protein